MSTEKQILKTARDIFFQKGYAGARMQEIADLAGINKAMLHYYFKTKDQLFDRVFTDAFTVFTGKIAEILTSEASLDDKIRAYVHHTIDSLLEDPGIPVFVLHELTSNPEKIAGAFAINNTGFAVFEQQVHERTSGKINAEHLFTDMVALCVYPFIAGPLLGKIMDKTLRQYSALMEERKEYIIAGLINKL
jgi:TetR/AcrR family transcriptional regulator